MFPCPLSEAWKLGLRWDRHADAAVPKLQVYPEDPGQAHTAIEGLPWGSRVTGRVRGVPQLLRQGFVLCVPQVPAKVPPPLDTCG